MSIRPLVKAELAAVALAALLAGCGTATKLAAHLSPAKRDSSSMAGMNMSGSSGMAGMNVAENNTSVATEVPSVNGVKPVASQVLATANWQGMTIQARTMTPTAFVVYDGNGHEQMMKPAKNASFHLMIMLNDEHTGFAIPYASVWATILNSSGRVVYDEQQWPMISAYMGSHYGNNVTLPGAGHYTLKLLISPPVSARHLEYQHVWRTKHEVTESFTWKPAR